MKGLIQLLPPHSDLSVTDSEDRSYVRLRCADHFGFSNQYATAPRSNGNAFKPFGDYWRALEERGRFSYHPSRD